MPDAVPTNEIAVEPSRFNSSRATAMPGYR
jgi:hypothetical protein